jgi:uncharacterized protein DUF6789
MSQEEQNRIKRVTLKELSMGDVSKGIEAGFVATIVISLLMLIQQAAGVAPTFNLITLITAATNMPDYVAISWIVHFVVGVGLWGVGFAAFSPHLPGPHWLRGLIFGAFAWFLMMVIFLPAAGMPVFANGLGTTIPVISLMLHLVYGAVIGESYHLLLHYLPSEVDENA